MRKTALGIALLLLGALLGGVLFYAAQRGTYSSNPLSGEAPRISADIKQTARAFSEIVRVVSPSVVNISSTREITNPGSNELEEFFSPFYDFEQKGSELSLGSGVIVSGNGYIITNNHVVADSNQIKVTLYDKRTFKGTLIGADPKTDIAVVKIDADGLPTANWGDSDDLSVGEFVLAIGNPFSLSHTVTMGIVSAVGRANVGIADYEDFIQTDAAINPGNSGGPLVNTQGRIIGINTAIFSKSGGYQGIGFAVPSNMARSIMDQLVNGGKVVRGWLGVSIQEMTPEMARKFGVETPMGALVNDLTKGSPAQKAGLRRGDVIVEYNGKQVKDASSLKNMVAQSRPGSTAQLKVARGSGTVTISVQIGEYPVELSRNESGGKIQTASRHNTGQSFFAGLRVTELSKDIARQLGLAPNGRGVVILQVEHGSAAEEAGLKRGDVIEEIDRKSLGGLGDFNLISSKLPRNEESVLLLVNRSEKRFFLSLTRE